MNRDSIQYLQIAFRVDATPQIGTGHFMRCLTLADELRKANCNVSFICHDLPAHFAAMLSEREISWLPLTGTSSGSASDGLAHSHWLWTDQAHDAEACLQLMSATNWDWVIVDHYALDYRWEACLRKVTRKIMVIDDLADRRHDCDVLLDQNMVSEINVRYQTKVPDQCNCLLGPQFALLRSEFNRLRQSSLNRRKNPKLETLLIFMGGCDAENETAKVIEGVKLSQKHWKHIDVVVGAGFPMLDVLRNELAINLPNSMLHIQTPNMAQLMVEADLAITAGGSVTWEKCVLGLPSLVVIQGDNQYPIATKMHKLGALRTLGHAVEQSAASYAVQLDNIQIQDLISMARVAESICDGSGAIQILKVLGISL